MSAPLCLGTTVTARKNDFRLSLFGIANVGELGIGTLSSSGTVVSGFTGATAASQTGGAFRMEIAKPVGRSQMKAQLVHATGDNAGAVGHGFSTPMALFGTSGYWGYNHIYTANGPSDVNGLGLDIGNRGAGLTTIQAMDAVSIAERVGLDMGAGWFRSEKPRVSGRNMGYEVSANLRIKVAGSLHLDVGAAGARLGTFFAEKSASVHEVFSRLQLQY